MSPSSMRGGPGVRVRLFSRRFLGGILLPCLILLAVTLPQLGQGDFRKDTIRYAAVGHYMWSGGALGEPHMNPTTPYFNKPPLALWVHGLFLSVFGRDLAVARLPSIMAALMVLCFSFLVARRLGSHAEALVSAIVLALTYEFFRRTREISLDMWQLAFLMMAAWMAVRGARSASNGWVAGAGIPMGLALLCKPLVGFVLLPLLAGWFLLMRRPRAIITLFAGTLPIAILVAFPWHWHMWQVFGDAFVRQYFFHEVVDRASGRLQTNPPTYYLAALAKHYWPWLLAVIYALYVRFRSAAQTRTQSRDLVVLGGTWTLGWLLLLSLFPDKKINYALPLYPGLAWIAAAGLCRLPWQRLRAWYKQDFRWLPPAAAAGLLAGSLIPIEYQAGVDKDWNEFFGWSNRKDIQSGDLAYGDMPLGDICYFYIKTGWWPQPLQATNTPGTHKYLLTKPQTPLSTSVNARVVFQNSKLVVLEQGSTNP